MLRAWDVDKGEDTPVFSSAAQAQRIMGLMMRHMNDVAGTLLEVPRLLPIDQERCEEPAEFVVRFEREHV